MTKVVWRETPKDHDYPVAATSLALLTSADTIEAVITGLRSAPLTRQKAKDMLRTSRLPLLAHVNARRGRPQDDPAASAAVLVRGNLVAGIPPDAAADGYRRFRCRIAVYPQLP
jgi:hypothetical protein